MQYILDIMPYICYTSHRLVIMKNIKIKIARIEADLSQEQLAEAVGVTRQTIGLIETGDYNPSLKLCLAICHALHKTLNNLFWEE